MFKQNKPNFFFIHNYKVMGSTIMRQLPEEYLEKFYGNITVSEYEYKNNIKLPKLRNDFKNQILAIDHLTLDELLSYNILSKQDIPNFYCMGIIRDVIDRFMSVCNFENMSPEEIIHTRLIKDSKLFHSQLKFFKQNYPWRIQVFYDKDKDGIKNWFRYFGIELDLDKQENVSDKKYKKEDLTLQQINFLNDYYREDIEFVEQVKKYTGFS